MADLMEVTTSEMIENPQEDIPESRGEGPTGRDRGLEGDHVRGVTDTAKENLLPLGIDPPADRGETTIGMTMVDPQTEILGSTPGKRPEITPEWKEDTVTLAMVGGAENAARRP